MLRSCFDARFVAACAQTYSLSWLRVALAFACVGVLGAGLGWQQAFVWGGVTLLIELLFRGATRPMARGASVSHAAKLRAFAAFWLAVPAWSVPGVLLWLAEPQALDVAAAAYFGGHILYIQAHHSHSPGAMLPAMPSVFAPFLTAALWPQYSGVHHLLILFTMGAVVWHALSSTAVSLRASASLLQAKDEAEAASRVKSAFLATMSHEIRTPLNGVLGMAHAIASDPLITPLQRQRIDIIRDSGEALLAILNDIIDLSKVEAQKLELEAIPFDLEEVARGAHQAFTALANKKGLSFSLVVEPAAAGVYQGDPTRLRQILYNLISNALKFTDEGEVEVRLLRLQEELVLRVRDTGVGLSSEAAGRLFRTFEQADSSVTRRYGGAGLGLSIVRELSTLMGGSVGVESQPGQGSTFIVRLPLKRLDGEHAPAGPPADTCEPRLADELRVLVAEDNQVNQLVVRTLLAQIGIDPVIVADGAAAVAAWRSGGVDVILMDVQMPVMDGLTAARMIRGEEDQRGLPRTPIIALTANAMAHQLASYAEAGMDAHVSKPISPGLLFAALEALASPAEPQVPPPEPASASVASQ